MGHSSGQHLKEVILCFEFFQSNYRSQVLDNYHLMSLIFENYILLVECNNIMLSWTYWISMYRISWRVLWLIHYLKVVSIMFVVSWFLECYQLRIQRSLFSFILFLMEVIFLQNLLFDSFWNFVIIILLTKS